jgi:hypothetical protein
MSRICPQFPPRGFCLRNALQKYKLFLFETNVMIFSRLFFIAILTHRLNKRSNVDIEVVQTYPELARLSDKP